MKPHGLSYVPPAASAVEHSRAATKDASTDLGRAAQAAAASAPLAAASPPGRLRAYLAQFKSELGAIAIYSMLTNLLMLAPTLYLLQLYDRIIQSRSEMTLLAVTLITLMLFGVMALADWLRSRVAIKAGTRLDTLLTTRLFALGLSSQGASSASQQALQDLTLLRQFVTGSGMFAFFDLPWTLLYIAVLFILSPILGWLAIGLCLLQFALAVWNQRSSEQPLADSSAARMQVAQFLESKLRNLSTLHVLGMLPSLKQRWQQLQSGWNQHDAAAQQIQQRNQLLNKFARYSMQSGMLGIAAWLAVRGDISIGAMIASNVLIARALQPFDVIVSTWKPFMQARACAANLDVLLADAPAALQAPTVAQKDNSTTLSLTGHLSLRGLEVTPPAGQALLRDITLEIRPGEILGILGASGSGKTTLLRCLVNTCPWQQGDILVDGFSRAQLPAGLYAQAIGYLPQEVALLDGSIAGNIARFQTPDPEAILQAAQAAGIHEAILRLPQGYDTPLNAESKVLSGGQRQLLGLARALYQQPAIIVLDEPNAHLDEHGEASLLAALLLLKNQGKTIVMVSHRQHSLRITDQLLVLEQGAMRLYGPRDQVLATLDQARQQAVSKVA
ncbi:MAG: type I secretion system permease/ATPase [Methylobacillus glycogenes]|nr:type I secretion system permease/ATPase [Methylobacillus glycogenes]